MEYESATVMRNLLNVAEAGDKMRTFLTDHVSVVKKALMPYVERGDVKWRHYTSVYWIVAHGEEEGMLVMDNELSDKARALLDAARILVLRIDEVAERVQKGVFVEEERALKEALEAYAGCFEAWSDDCKSLIVGKICHSIRTLWIVYPLLTREIKKKTRKLMGKQLFQHFVLEGATATNAFVASLTTRDE